MEFTRGPTEFDQNNRDVTPIPGYVIKKNRSRGAKHGASERQEDVLPCETETSKGPDRESTEAILRYFQDGTEMKNTGSHFLTSDGENTT